MLRNFRINPHGIVAVLLVILMFGIAFFLDWNINWVYFSVSVALYSVAVISLTLIEEASSPSPLIFRLFIGCHLAVLFFAVGLFFSDPNEWYFVGSGFVFGLAISFLLLRTSEDRNVLHLHGLIALLLITLMVGVAFLYVRTRVSEVYAVVYLACVEIATLAYIVATIVLKSSFSYGKASSRVLKLQLGCHLAFIFLIVGFVLPLKNVGSVIAYFILGVAVGLAIPYVLIRSSSR